MGGVSDIMLGGSCAVLVENLHAESVLVLTGPDVGKSFLAVNEVQPDIAFDSELSTDYRAKRVLRFRIPNVPNLSSQDRVQTADGLLWRAVRRPDSAYLTADFELSQITKLDTSP